MSNKFKLDKSKLQDVLNVISFRDKLDRRVLKFSPDGLTAFENSSSSAFAIIECPKEFYEKLPDSDFAMIILDGFGAGLNYMNDGVVNFSVEETGQGKQTIRMEDESGKRTYEEPVQVPQGDEAIFPIETGIAADAFELRMIAPKFLTAVVNSEDLSSLPKSNIERYRMVWKPDGTLFVTTEMREGGMTQTIIPVNYIEKPAEEVKIDIEPMLFQSQLRNFKGEFRLTIHITDTVRGITMTQRVGDHNIGYTLIGMNPI